MDEIRFGYFDYAMNKFGLNYWAKYFLELSIANHFVVNINYFPDFYL